MALSSGLGWPVCLPLSLPISRGHKGVWEGHSYSGLRYVWGLRALLWLLHADLFGGQMSLFLSGSCLISLDWGLGRAHSLQYCMLPHLNFWLTSQLTFMASCFRISEKWYRPQAPPSCLRPFCITWAPFCTCIFRFPHWLCEELRGLLPWLSPGNVGNVFPEASATLLPCLPCTGSGQAQRGILGSSGLCPLTLPGWLGLWHGMSMSEKDVCHFSFCEGPCLHKWLCLSLLAHKCSFRDRTIKDGDRIGCFL